MKLSKTQQIVLNLVDFNWQSAYELQCSLATLNSLVKFGLIETKIENGYIFMPRICKLFRKKLINPEEQTGQA